MRQPDLIIGPRDNPQTLRWQLLKFRGWQLCLHKWLRSDEDRALHDHSGDNISLLLNRGYWEVVRRFTWNDSGVIVSHQDRWTFRWPLIPYFRRAETPHRIVMGEHRRGLPVWSLWFRWPPRRDWGFHCPKGWKHWRDFLSSRNDYYADGTSEVGPGCD